MPQHLPCPYCKARIDAPALRASILASSAPQAACPACLRALPAKLLNQILMGPSFGLASPEQEAQSPFNARHGGDEFQLGSFEPDLLNSQSDEYDTVESYLDTDKVETKSSPDNNPGAIDEFDTDVPGAVKPSRDRDADDALDDSVDFEGTIDLDATVVLKSDAPPDDEQEDTGGTVDFEGALDLEETAVHGRRRAPAEEEDTGGTVDLEGPLDLEETAVHGRRTPDAEQKDTAGTVDLEGPLDPDGTVVLNDDPNPSVESTPEVLKSTAEFDLPLAVDSTVDLELPVELDGAATAAKSSESGDSPEQESCGTVDLDLPADAIDPHATEVFRLGEGPRDVPDTESRTDEQEDVCNYDTEVGMPIVRRNAQQPSSRDGGEPGSTASEQEDRGGRTDANQKTAPDLGRTVDNTSEPASEELASKKTVPEIGQTLDSPPDRSVPGAGRVDPSQQTVPEIGQTLDSPPDRSVPGAGRVDPSQQTVPEIGQTLDGDSVEASPGQASEGKKTAPNLDQTIDGEADARGPSATTAEGHEATLDSDLDMSVDGQGGRTVRGSTRQSDPLSGGGSGSAGGSGSGRENRMLVMWSSVDRSMVDSGVTIQGQEAESPSAQRTSLVIQSRALLDREAPGPQDAGSADYELLRRLGEGGMGVVFAARQASIDRTVAIKMLKPQGARDEKQRRKFLTEAVVTAELEHPNIVPIHDLGTNDDGSLFYSMKRVQGTPWDDVIQQMSLIENVMTLLKVADAVAFAHNKGVIHRDLKPENVMLGEFGEVLVMDWGLAVPMKTRQVNSAGGTPAYMAPEMAAGPYDSIGACSDIYLLGAILFEIVTGKPPHTGSTVMKCLMAAAKNEIRPTDKTGELMDVARKAMAAEIDDRYGSVKEFQVAIQGYLAHAESIQLADRSRVELEQARRSGDYEQFSRSLFGFQEALNLWPGNQRAKRGLEESRGSYAAAAHQKGDLDLALSMLSADNPAQSELRAQVLAEQAERNARKARLQRAKRMLVGLLATLGIVVTGAALLIEMKRRDAVQQRAIALENEKEANSQRALAVRNAEEALQQKEKADLNFIEAERQRDAAEKAKDEESAAKKIAEQKRVEAEEATQAAVAAQLLEVQARRKEEMAKLEAIRAREQEEQAKVAAIQAKEQEEQAKVAAIQAKEQEEYEAYIARIGLAAAKIEENAFGQARDLLVHCKPQLRNWEWGRLMHLCTQSSREFDAEAPVDSVDFHDATGRVAAGAWNGEARIWSVDDGRRLLTIPHAGRYVYAVAFSPDGRMLATGGSSPQTPAQVFNAESGELIRGFAGHEDAVLAVAFSSDGQRLLTASFDNTARLWDVASGRQLQVFRGHTWWVWSAEFSPDEKQIVTASQDGTVRVWDVESGRHATPFREHRGPVFSATFSPDGKSVASGGYDQTIRLWSPLDVEDVRLDKLRADQPIVSKHRELSHHTAAVRSVQFAPDGRRLFSGSQDNTVVVCALPSGKPLTALRGHDSWVRSCAVAADGGRVFSGSHDHSIRMWDLAGYEEQRVLRGRMLAGHADAILGVAFSPQGDAIVTASRDRSARLWRVSDAAPLRQFREGHSFLATSAAFLQQGRLLATSAVDNTARIWNVETGTETARLPRTGRSATLAVSPGGEWLLTGSDDRTAKLWRIADLAQEAPQPARVLSAHRADVTAAAINARGDVIITGDATGRCLVWGAGAAPLGPLAGHTRRITGIGLPGGDLSGLALVASADNTVSVWDVASRASRGELPHPDSVDALSVASEAPLAVTVCGDGQARVWNLTTLQAVRTLQAGGEPIGAASISADGRRVLTVEPGTNRVRMWDVAGGGELTAPDGGPLLDLERLGIVVWNALFADNGDVLTVGGDSAQLWDAASGVERLSFRPHGAVASARVSPDGRHVLTASWDGSARVWDVATGKATAKLGGELESDGARSVYINCAVYSPSGELVLTASDDGMARLWGLQTGEVIRVFEGHTDRVLSGEFSSDGRLIATASLDHTVRLWDAASGQALATIPHPWGVRQAVLDRGSQRLLTAGEDNIARVWSVSPESLAEMRQANAAPAPLVELHGHTAPINSVAFSPDGRRALTGSADHSAKLWDAVTGKEILTLDGHPQEVTSVAFSPDGLQALTGGRDGAAILWLALPWTEAVAK